MLNVNNVHKKLGLEEVNGLLKCYFKGIDDTQVQASVLSLACLWFNEIHRNDSSVHASILENVLFYAFVEDVEDEATKEALYLAILEEVPTGSFFASYLAILTNQRLMTVTAHLVRAFEELSLNNRRFAYNFLTA